MSALIAIGARARRSASSLPTVTASTTTTRSSLTSQAASPTGSQPWGSSMAEAMRREFVGITDQALDALRQRIEHTLEPWCYEATRDNIRHYANGIGDDNLLWCDPAYGKTTRYGDIIALPSFLFACSRIVSGYVGGLPGVHAMFAGCDFTWYKPIHRNAQMTTSASLKDLIAHDTRFAGRAIQQISHVAFSDETDDQLA